MDTIAKDQSPPPIDFAEIQKELLIRHKIVVGENDPILATVAINEIILSRYLDLISAHNQRYQRELSAAIYAQAELAKEGAKKIAEQIVTAGAEYVANQACLTVETSVRKTIEDALDQINAIKGEAQEMKSVRSGAMWAAITAGLCAFVSAIAAVTIILH